MNLRSLVFVALLITSQPLQAGLGETPIQFADRYGRPIDSPVTKITDKTFPLMEGAIHHTYEYQGWKIRAAFLELDQPAVRMDFQKLPGTGTTPVIQDYELQAIVSANTPSGMSWRHIPYNNPDSPNKGLAKAGEAVTFERMGWKMWQRSDGAVLSVRGRLVVRLELPAAREFETQRKAAKDQKARASVPNF